MRRKNSLSTEKLHEAIIDAYQGVETRELTHVRNGETFTRRMSLRIFRWRDGNVTKEGNAEAFARFLNVSTMTVHQVVRLYGGESMRDGTKGKGIGSHARSAVVREDIIDEGRDQ